MEFIDVTLRDGGHQVGFNWPEHFVVNFLPEIAALDSVSFVEVGYWGQKGKFEGPYYSLDNASLRSLFPQVTGAQLAVMTDYHYAIRDLEAYPSSDTDPMVGLIRVTARQDEFESAVAFMHELSAYTGIPVSCNIFNVTNYSSEHLDYCVDYALKSDVAVIAFADTHGSLDLDHLADSWQGRISRIHSQGKMAGIHLHDHLGFARTNYRISKELGFDYCDVSLKGIGKGLGNLRLEHCIDISERGELLRLWAEYDKFMELPTGPWAYLTARFSATDHYAEQARALGLSPNRLRAALVSMSRDERDNYRRDLLVSN